MSGSRIAHRRVSPLATAALGATLLAGLLPAAAMAAGGAVRDAGPAGEPSIAYLESMAHEQDAISFEPGGVVSVPFAPRPDDRWPVGGREPAALPAGRASGIEMAASPNGAAWADLGPRDGSSPGPGDGAGPAATDAPVDAPASDPTLSARGAAYAQPADPSVDLAAASGLRRQVFGFLPYWEVPGASTKLNYDVLSTIAYFSVGANARGDLKKRDRDGSLTTGWGGWTSSSMTKVINEAHDRGTRVVLTISVFAWTSSQADVQRSILGSATARRNLARQAAAAVRDRGADGVNLDFEPLASGYESEFVAFLRTLRSELNRIRSGYQVTYDTTGFIGNYPLEASVGSDAADAIFIMGYDYRTGSSGTAGSIDPLSGPRYDLTDTVRSYTARVGPSRVILGLPWYGRAWSTTGDEVRSDSQSGAKYGASTAVNYESVTSLISKYGRRWDASEQSPYVAYRRQNCTTTYGCVTSWRQVYYDDATSLKLRLGMVNDYRLRGAGMWALGYDGGHPELYRAFAESFLVDKSAPQAGIRMPAGTQVDEGFVVTWSAKDTSNVVSYDVQSSIDGGAWTTWLSGTRATSDVWLGKDGTGYAFRVRARDSKGNVGAWNVSSTWDGNPSLGKGGFGRVTTNGLAYRAGPDTSSAKLGTLDAGTIVAVSSGPVSSDGYTWFEVTQPIREWNPVTFVERGVWVAVRSSSTTNVVAYRAPNSTTVNARLVGLDFGSGPSRLGTGATALAGRVFSPDGDGSGDTIRLRWTNAVAMDGLVLRVFKANGTRLGEVDVPARASGGRSWEWNGRVAGSRVTDGRYVLQLVGSANGKTYTAPSARPTTPVQVARYAVTVDTVDPVVTASSVSTTLISPNGDGTLDSTKLAIGASGATRWTARITNAGGSAVRSASGSGGSGSLTWKGTDDGGATLPDGRYRGSVSAWDHAGNAATRSWTITLDTTGPAITPTASLPIFSPNGDGTADTTVLGWTANEKGTGTARLYRGTTLVRSWNLAAATAGSVTWNGRRADGAPAPDGRYTFKISLRDAAGNARTASKPVVVDRTARTLAWNHAFYAGDGDALRPNAVVSWHLARDATTTLRLYDAADRLVRTVWTDRSQKAGDRAWTWNGRLADGTVAPQGRYTAKLTVRSRLGTLVLARPVWAAAFAITPSATRVTAGKTLTIRFSATEPLHSRPVVSFRQPGLAAVKVTATRLSDGTFRASFTVRSGATGAATVRVTATDTGGGTNGTSIPITIAAR